MSLVKNNVIQVPPFDHAPHPKGLGNLFFEKIKQHGAIIAQVSKLPLVYTN